ncbi:MAG TPA: hypothetical protein VGO86_12175, partial [Candidatus Dormibacteraeota bacterium]
MVSHVAHVEGESGHSCSIHESVRRLVCWRSLMVAGVSVAAALAIGSTGAMASNDDDHGRVQRSSSNTSGTSVDGSGDQSTGLIAGPIIVRDIGTDAPDVSSTKRHRLGAPPSGAIAVPIVAPASLRAGRSQAESVDRNGPGSGSGRSDRRDGSSSGTTDDDRDARSPAALPS